jgi:hypothetical protein
LQKRRVEAAAREEELKRKMMKEAREIEEKQEKKS